MKGIKFIEDLICFFFDVASEKALNEQDQVINLIRNSQCSTTGRPLMSQETWDEFCEFKSEADFQAYAEIIRMAANFFEEKMTKVLEMEL